MEVAAKNRFSVVQTSHRDDHRSCACLFAKSADALWGVAPRSSREEEDVTGQRPPR